MTKRLFAAALALIMALSMLPVSALAVDDTAQPGIIGFKYLNPADLKGQLGHEYFDNDRTGFNAAFDAAFPNPQNEKKLLCVIAQIPAADVKDLGQYSLTLTPPENGRAELIKNGENNEELRFAYGDKLFFFADIETHLPGADPDIFNGPPAVGDYTAQLKKADTNVGGPSIFHLFSLFCFTPTEWAKEPSTRQPYNVVFGGVGRTYELPGGIIDGRKVTGWKLEGQGDVVAPGTNVELKGTRYEINYVAELGEEVSGVQAGFRWIGQLANDDINGRAHPAQAVTDCCDETVWAVVQRQHRVKIDECYWVQILVPAANNMVIFEEAAVVKEGTDFAFTRFSFLSPRNQGNVNVPSKLQVKAYYCPNGFPSNGGNRPSDLDEANATMSEVIEVRDNPLQIADVDTSNASYGVMWPQVTVENMGNPIRGRYWAEITRKDSPNTVVAAAPFANEGEYYGPVVETEMQAEFTAGDYVFSIYPGNCAGEGRKPYSIALATKEFTLANNITDVDVHIGHTTEYEDGTASTAITGRADNAAKKIYLSGKIVNDEPTIKVTIYGFDADNHRAFCGGAHILLERNQAGTGYTLAETNGVLTKFPAIPKADYEIDVSGVTCIPAEVDTTPTQPEVTTGTGVDTGKQDVKDVVDALTPTEGNSDSIQLGSDEEKEGVNTEKAIEDAVYNGVNASDIENAKNQGAALLNAAADAVRIIVQTSLDIEIKSVKTEGGQKSITVNIVPQIQMVATTAPKDGTVTDSNSKPVGTKKELTITKPVTLTVPLPSSFVGNQGKAFVRHYKNGRSYIYKGDIEGTTNKILKFLNPHGFSDFEILLENPSVATVGDVGYEDLAEAIVAANSTEGKMVVIPDESKLPASVTLKTSVTGVKIVKLNDDEEPVALSKGIKINKKDYTAAELLAGIDVKVSSGGGTGGGSWGGGSGGGTTKPDAPTVSVTVPTVENGTVSVEPKSAKAGETVSVKVETKAPYYVVTKVVAKGDTTATAVKGEDGSYSFVMPEGSKVEVEAQIEHIFNLFTDVPTDIPEYGDSIKWAVEKGITLGNSADYATFGPKDSCIRSSMVVFLYRASGSPAVTGTNSFTDLPTDDSAMSQEIRSAVQWAVDNHITEGVSATSFDPHGTCSRDQMVTFLHRLKGKPAATGSNTFTDVDSSAFYAEAMQWAVDNSITLGTSATTFEPSGDCTRVQMVTFLKRLSDKVGL